MSEILDFYKIVTWNRNNPGIKPFEETFPPLFVSEIMNKPFTSEFRMRDFSLKGNDEETKVFAMFERRMDPEKRLEWIAKFNDEYKKIYLDSESPGYYSPISAYRIMVENHKSQIKGNVRIDEQMCALPKHDKTLRSSSYTKVEADTYDTEETFNQFGNEINVTVDDENFIPVTFNNGNNVHIEVSNSNDIIPDEFQEKNSLQTTMDKILKKFDDANRKTQNLIYTRNLSKETINDTKMVCNNTLKKLDKPKRTHTTILNLSPDLKSILPLRSDSQISKFLKNEEFKKEMANYLLTMHSEQELIQKGLAEFLHKEYILKHTWNYQTKFSTVPKNFKSFFTEIMMHDTFLSHQKTTFINTTISKFFADCRGNYKKNTSNE